MTKLIHIGAVLCLLIPGIIYGSSEFVRVERLSDRLIIGYWLGTGRTNFVAIKSQKGLVIIDTEMSPRIMAPIKKQLENTFGRNDWAYVINTHAHMHHAGGNSLFKGAVIVGHDNLPADMQWLIDKQLDETWKRKDLDNNARTIRNLQALLPRVAGNRMQTKRIHGEIKFFQLNTQDIREGFEIVKPTITFPDKYTLDLGDLRLELIYFGKGHSLSDILIYIPKERTLVTGAIVYQRGHLPGITENAELKDVLRYISVLDALLDKNIKLDHVIAAHSPVLTRNDLKLVRDYYITMLDGIKAAQQEGITLEQAKNRFAVHKKFPHYFQLRAAQWAKAKQDRNITVLWKRLKEANQLSEKEKKDPVQKQIIPHDIPNEHPRLLGSLERLKRLASERPDAYQRVVQVARKSKADNHAKMISMAIVCAIESDEQLGKLAVQMAMKYINGPIRSGHVTFGHDLARCAIVYDLCHEYWSEDQRAKFHEYMNRTVDANVRSETHVFHNGWYGYKHWGIGLACYATYYENERAQAILQNLEQEWLTHAAPALDLAGDGGGWAEGYYIHYWLYEWLFFCEAARYCQGIDYYADAPNFFNNRAIASMFETYPGTRTYNSRRSVPMGDGGGRLFGGDRDKILSARRILVNYFNDDPNHQVVHTFNETTPRSSVGVYAYKDFLWRDTSIDKGNINSFKLSHISQGPGYVYARSSWDEDATYFFFKCGDRFTAHQHLDVGHFLIYKYEELAGDGGHYDSFGSSHDVNYHLRSIAHNTILIHDPSETWPNIRAGTVTGNDGGQSHSWPHHNGAVTNPQQWHKENQLYDIADILAFEDNGEYLYVAGDCTRAYSKDKLDYFTRQIVFIRPGTFIIFDRVCSTNPQFKKTWLLQAMEKPANTNQAMVITNGNGRLFIQTLLPENPQVKLATGAELYSYGENNYPPSRDTGHAPQCRIEISPSILSKVDYFLHVLTATDAATPTVENAALNVTDQAVTVKVGSAETTFTKEEVGGNIILSENKTYRDFSKVVRPDSQQQKIKNAHISGQGTIKSNRPVANTPEKAILKFVLKLNPDTYSKSHYEKPPQFAIWLQEVPQGKTRTVWVTSKTGTGDWGTNVIRTVSLPYWVSRWNLQTKSTSYPTPENAVINALTGATPKVDFMTEITVPANSRWNYFIEVNVSGDYNDAFPISQKDGKRDRQGNGQPSIIYRGQITSSPGLRSSPELIGRTEQFQSVKHIITDLQGITTAKNLFSKIEVSCQSP